MTAMTSTTTHAPTPAQLPVCGDGIVQAGEGEACDDGNVHPGDGCTVRSAIPGALLWEVVIDLDDLMEAYDVGYEVVIDSEDNIGVLYMTVAHTQLGEFDSKACRSGISRRLNTDRPNLAIRPSDEFALGGKTNNSQGVTRLYDTLGNQVLDEEHRRRKPSVLGVGFDGAGNVIAAGFHADDDALLLRYDNMGLIGWSHFETDGVALGPVAVSSSGQIWNVRTMPRQLETYTDDGVAGCVSPMLENEGYEDVAANAEGNVLPAVGRVGCDVAQPEQVRQRRSWCGTSTTTTRTCSRSVVASRRCPVVACWSRARPTVRTGRLTACSCGTARTATC